MSAHAAKELTPYQVLIALPEDMVGPHAKLLEAFQFEADAWRLLDTAKAGEDVSLPPFDAVSFALNNLFPLDPPEEKQTGETG